jgi:REP element-mobilizing transposase RayT
MGTVDGVARPPRSALPDGYFHAFSRGVASPTPLFRDDDDRHLFLDLTWRAAGKHRWTLHAVCILGSHYHLVLETTRERLSSGLHWLNWSYARCANVKAGTLGHVFASRFGARSIAGEEYLYDACAYVLLNPVRAGLCDRVEDWPWSYSSFDRCDLASTRTRPAAAQSSAG